MLLGIAVCVVVATSNGVIPGGGRNEWSRSNSRRLLAQELGVGVWSPETDCSELLKFKSISNGCLQLVDTLADVREDLVSELRLTLLPSENACLLGDGGDIGWSMC